MKCTVWLLMLLLLQVNAASDSTQTDEEYRIYLRKLFLKYGSNGQTMKFEAFEHLLESLGLAHLKIHDHTIAEHKVKPGDFKDLHKSHNHSKPTSDAQTVRRRRSFDNSGEKCLEANQILEVFKMVPSATISDKVFMQMCPLLVEQIDSHACQQRSLRRQRAKEILRSPVALKQAANGSLQNATETKSYSLADIEGRVWLFSTISIVIISAVGLAGVAVVPCLQKVFYNHFIQFLVALAVGTLTGDAMLHLLPHAIVMSAMSDVHREEEHDEKATVYKGLVALGGVYFFFMAEKILALISEYRAEKKQLAEDMARHEESGPEAAMLRRASRLTNQQDELVLPGLSGKALRSMDNLRRYQEDDEEHSAHLHPNDHNDVTEMTALNTEENNKSPEVTIVLPESAPREAKAAAAHGHGHSHGSGEVPDSVAAVAWMVILGDGLHNFSDGLAIGAAFANNITGGISTSIAVFCHELPHELGDFAVLLKTGMKVKQALFYNMLSSVLCFIGMLIGVCLGNIKSASYWIFAITGGMFIYISLVDMLPELNLVNLKPGESRIAHFLIQNAGILTGVGIMLLIALFEENMKEMFG